MNKVLLLFSLSLITALQAYAQSKKIYYTSSWNETRSKAEMTYYKIIKQLDSNKYKISVFTRTDNKIKECEYLCDHYEYLKDYRSVVFRHGAFASYYNNGKKRLSGNYHDGAMDGLWTYYNVKGELVAEREFDKGDAIGHFVQYDSDGKLLVAISTNNKGLEKVIEGDKEFGNFLIKVYKDRLAFPSLNYPFINISGIDTSKVEKHAEKERMPEPKYDVYRFIAEHCKYPIELKRKGITGRVIVKFTVNRRGNIVDIESASPKVHKQLQLAAIEVVSKFPKWRPGKLDGKPVNVYYTLPIRFVLDGVKKIKH